MLKGLGAIAQYVEHWLLLWRTWVGFPAPTLWLKVVYNSSSRCSSVIFWPQQTRHVHGTLIHTQAKTHTHKINPKKLLHSLSYIDGQVPETPPVYKHFLLTS